MTDERGADPRRTRDDIEQLEEDASPRGEPEVNPQVEGGTVLPPSPERGGEQVDIDEVSPVLPDDEKDEEERD